MPRRNRVTPTGAIVAVPDRGTLMGNRGCLHDAVGAVRRAWQLRRWIVCVLEFKGRRRRAMTPGHYTELFFLDEATALAAGHRPCAECRRDRFNAFLAALGERPSAVALDRRLHAERITDGGEQRTHRAKLGGLPDGVFVRLPDDATASLLRGDELLAWSAGGYTHRVARPRGVEVEVLTPPLTVAALRGGYVPEVHTSGEAR